MPEDMPLAAYNRWDDPVFMARLHRSEYTLLTHLDTNFSSDRADAVAATLGDIQHQIGDDELDCRRQLLAYGYPYTPDGVPDLDGPGPRLIDTGRAILRAVSHLTVDDEDRVILEYHLQDGGDATVFEPIAVPLFAVLSTGPSMEVVEHGLSNYVDNSRCFAKKLLSDPEISFYTRSASEQQYLLREKVVKELIADISVEYDESVEVGIVCTKLYTPVEKGDFRAMSGRTICGSIIGVIYLEGQREYPIKITQPTDFISPEQLPSLVVADSRGEVCYVPISHITSFQEVTNSS